MERYGSDVEVDEQRTPLIRRGREEEVQKGERKNQSIQPTMRALRSFCAAYVCKKPRCLTGKKQENNNLLRLKT